MTEKDEVYVALLVINLGGTFSNAYGLCKFLDRKFDIFNCVGVINNLINDKLVECNEINGVKQFYIAEKGYDVIKQERNRIIEILKQEFPREINAIDEL